MIFWDNINCLHRCYGNFVSMATEKTSTAHLKLGKVNISYKYQLYRYQFEFNARKKNTRNKYSELYLIQVQMEQESLYYGLKVQSPSGSSLFHSLRCNRQNR